MSIESGLAFFLAIIIFAITPGPGVLVVLSKAMTQSVSSCFPLALGIAFSASWARQYFKSERAMRGLNRVAGSIMAGAGIYIGVRA